jgi:MraZ protein
MRCGAESRFFGSYVNKIDAKGRLATPARFRRVLENAKDNEIYCAPSPTEPCLECGGGDYVDYLMDMVEQLEPFSPERRSLERIYAGRAFLVSLDQDGRILLPQHLRERAHLDGEAMFVGHGRYFQIWRPAAYENVDAEIDQEAGAARLTLRNPSSVRASS